jgi:hypothetical protein
MRLYLVLVFTLSAKPPLAEGAFPIGIMNDQSGPYPIPRGGVPFNR